MIRDAQNIVSWIMITTGMAMSLTNTGLILLLSPSTGLMEFAQKLHAKGCLCGAAAHSCPFLAIPIGRTTCLKNGRNNLCALQRLALQRL